MDRRRKKEAALDENLEGFMLTQKDSALIFVNSREDEKERAARFTHHLFNLIGRLGKKIEIQSRREAITGSFKIYRKQKREREEDPMES